MLGLTYIHTYARTHARLQVCLLHMACHDPDEGNAAAAQGLWEQVGADGEKGCVGW